MSYYDAIWGINSAYSSFISNYGVGTTVNRKIYFQWRDFLEIQIESMRRDWTNDFDSLVDYISHSIFEDLYLYFEFDSDSFGPEHFASILVVDEAMRDYCKRQIEYDGVIFLIKNKVTVKDKDYLFEAIRIAES